MSCIVCGAQMQSHPEAETDWRALEVDGYLFYACPNEFPPDGSSKEAFKTDYQIVMACCFNEITKAAGGSEILELEAYCQARRKAQQFERKSKPKGFS